MYLKLKVHPSSKEDKIIRKSPDNLEVFVRAKPVDGKANEAVMEQVRAFLGVPRSRLRIVKGFSSRNKVVQLLD